MALALRRAHADDLTMELHIPNSMLMMLRRAFSALPLETSLVILQLTLFSLTKKVYITSIEKQLFSAVTYRVKSITQISHAPVLTGMMARSNIL
jgi:hypothetical protein